jgi:two-component system, chemotaxis family, protein-glutamate methylesterase/glutaminase
MNTLSSNSPPIRVLIADDSAVMRAALTRVVESAPSLQVCGTARHGLEALEKIRQLRPDVVTLDVEMPQLNGLEVLKRIMSEFPRPVIMVSSLTQEGAEVTLEALGVGAFDYLPKAGPGQLIDPHKLKRELIEKIEAAAHSPLARKFDASPALAPVAPTVSLRQEFHTLPEIIALGTSTGGPKALQDILPHLPADLPVGILIVQHMPPGFTAPFAKRLNTICKAEVREAVQGESIEAGTIYIAPAGRHVTVARKPGSKATIHLSDSPPGTLHKPSVDVMMLSVAETFGRNSAGVILTGMGSDGLQGMTAIRQAGGITIGQDELTCAVYGMPRACAESGILQRIVPLDLIPRQILNAVRYKPKETLIRCTASASPAK